jgi:hypothetical protein
MCAAPKLSRPTLCQSGHDQLPQSSYIRINFHPSSQLKPKILSIPEYQMWREGKLVFRESGTEPVPPPDNPFFPLKSKADADFLEFVYSRKLSNPIIDEILSRLPTWSSGSSLSFRSHRDIEQSIRATRETSIQVCMLSPPLVQSTHTNKFETKTISESYIDRAGQEVTEDFTFKIRPLKALLEETVNDPALLPHIHWWPSRRYLVFEGKETLLTDDLDVGTDWWDTQVRLPISFASSESSAHQPRHSHGI